MTSELQEHWNFLNESIGSLHEQQTLLPVEFIQGRLLPAIAIVAVALTVIYVIIHSSAARFLPDDTPKQKRSKICYQLVNFLFNVAIGSVGVYLEYWVLPSLNEFTGSSVDRAWGHANELYLVSAMQLGYQFWAIPVGILYVNETKEMVLHHFAVVVSTSMSGFMTVGFRYYTPFFYGIMELSSLPLAVMNTFKDNPDWVKRYPKAYANTRIVFAISFLVIRVIMCAPRWMPFLRDNFLFMYTAPMGLLKVYLFVQWSFAAFLAGIQLFWAHKIVVGLAKVLFGKKEKAA